ncbi:hypothetical protein PLANPX_2748 [Lacipirellula parvula]|uniref:Uncharacterized protein n=1 Tax=Lacipirellula parvula TaxID=2650471 RepID=A0A5K7XFL5_9BACT|nr:hypothetical protein PLANPX_2748 [Lacipirellula parvula]
MVVRHVWFLVVWLPPPGGEGWGGGKNPGTRISHPSLTLPFKGRGPEGLIGYVFSLRGSSKNTLSLPFINSIAFASTRDPPPLARPIYPHSPYQPLDFGPRRKEMRRFVRRAVTIAPPRSGGAIDAPLQELCFQ